MVVDMSRSTASLRVTSVGTGSPRHPFDRISSAVFSSWGGQNDIGTGFSQRNGDGLSDTPSGAGDNRHFAFQVDFYCHACFPPGDAAAKISA
jgi:hypothetical protein